MVPIIEVDDEVYAQLQGRAQPFVDTPNDVIKRLLIEAAEEAPRRAGSSGATPPGRLLRLVDAGLVKDGDKVRHRRKRTGEVFEATITDGGCLRVDGVHTLFREPSPALRHFTGVQIDGWHHWVHVDSQRTLRQLRDQ